MPDYTPRAENVRMLAMAAYLPLVGLVLLNLRAYREIRLIRFHSFQAIGLAIMLILLLLLGSVLSTLFGSLPGIGLLINMGVGALFAIGLLGTTVMAFYAAAMAYQGNYTNFPILTDWVWLQVHGSGRPQPSPPKKRRRRREARAPEETWEESAVPPAEEPW